MPTRIRIPVARVASIRVRAATAARATPKTLHKHGIFINITTALTTRKDRTRMNADREILSEAVKHWEVLFCFGTSVERPRGLPQSTPAYHNQSTTTTTIPQPRGLTNGSPVRGAGSCTMVQLLISNTMFLVLSTLNHYFNF